MACDGDEIADSDGESDVDDAPSPPRSQLLPKTDQGQTVPDIDLGVDFSDFLSQSQTHHMNATQQSVRQEDHPEAVEKSTGTTASLRRQIESEQRKLAEQKSSSSTRRSDIKKRSKSSSDSPTVAKTKRRHSELGSTSLMEGQESRQKRQHTYGSSSSSCLRSSQSDVFAEQHRHQLDESLAEVASSRDLEHASYQPEDDGRTYDQQTELTAGVGQHHIGSHSAAVNEESALQCQDGIQADHIRGTSDNADALEEYMQMSSGRISKSRSLMGNYESINLDYSDGGLGLNVNANPFGDASQQSVEDITDRTQSGRREAIFTPSKASTLATIPLSGNRDSLANNVLHPHISGIDGASSLRENSYSQIGSGRSRSFVDPSVLTKYPADNSQELADSKSSCSRKRRKTADGFALNFASTAHDTDIPPILLAATEETPPPKTETQGKKRGRKPKNQNVEPSNGHHSEEQNEESVECAAKHMSSELHFDDDSIIGLPKEQYKPRPSRSRSKRSAEEEMPPPAPSPTKSVHTPTKQPQTSHSEDTAQPNDPEDTPLTKLKKEKKKKNKMKRAKTSAAALLKKSDRMLSDGEEDVVWVDSKPATVKMKLPDPVEVKEEYLKTAKVPPEDNEVGPAGAAEIPINLPQTEEEPHRQPPKKRGRKKKTAAETPVANETEDGSNGTTNASAEAEEPPPVGDEATSNEPRVKASALREALKEKDVNTPHTATSHPINEDTSTPQGNRASEDTDTTSAGRQESRENQQQPAPPTPTPQAKSSENSEKGPTKHSPINPTGGKVKYRVGLSRRAAIPPLLKIVRK